MCELFANLLYFFSSFLLNSPVNRLCCLTILLSQPLNKSSHEQPNASLNRINVATVMPCRPFSKVQTVARFNPVILASLENVTFL